MKKAIVLLSGGLDSTTCLAYAIAQGYACHALSFSYGQRHHSELLAAKKICSHLNVPHKIFDIAIDQFKNSALTDNNIEIPDYVEGNKDIPCTYVPARNTIFLSIALAYAEILSAHDIFIGVSAIDYSHYPDCRPQYISAFQTMANLATKMTVEQGSIQLHTPLIALTKAQTIALGHQLKVDYAMTISCYQADQQGRACGKCDSCAFRKKGFAQANLNDPTPYY
jgi:7-cyano-7-deazaguanine synthase